MPKIPSKDFKAYPKRTFTLSDETWILFKNAKIKYGKNWEAFIKELLVTYETTNKKTKR